MEKDPFIEWLQKRLIAKGFEPGRPDGIWGRLTRNALVAFQKRYGLVPNGKADNATVEALRASAAIPDVKKTLDADYPWMQIAKLKKGLHETDPILKQFLKSDKKTLGDPAKLPWCGDFVETPIALALPNEALPVNPYLARNWLNFGFDPKTPGYGDVLVFSRPGSAWSGHVGFYFGEDKTAYHVLGGNQSNRVTIARILKKRLLGARRPLTGTRVGQKVLLASDGSQLSTNEA